ncbi:hypothetical protein Tco_1307191 [Tanacetum coccineum]
MHIRDEEGVWYDGSSLKKILQDEEWSLPGHIKSSSTSGEVWIHLKSEEKHRLPREENHYPEWRVGEEVKRLGS